GGCSSSSAGTRTEVSKKYFTESFRELYVRAPRARGELFRAPHRRKAVPRREAPKFLVFSACVHCLALAVERCVPLSFPIPGSRPASVVIHPVLAWAARADPSYRA